MICHVCNTLCRLILNNVYCMMYYVLCHVSLSYCWWESLFCSCVQGQTTHHFCGLTFQKCSALLLKKDWKKDWKRPNLRKGPLFGGQPALRSHSRWAFHRSHLCRREILTSGGNRVATWPGSFSWTAWWGIQKRPMSIAMKWWGELKASWAYHEGSNRCPGLVPVRGG